MRLVIGCGYVGRRVAEAWVRAGHEVAALSRSDERAGEFAAAGLRPIVGDVTDPGSLDNLPAADVVLHAVGFDRSAGPSQREVYVDGLVSGLERVAATTRRFVYVSSTSVYGQADGEWVDETSPTEPVREGGRLCLEAERLVRDAFDAPHATVALRLAGIYGPGRLLRRTEALRGGEPIGGNPEAWLNLIHVNDAVTTILAAADASTPRDTYLVADDEPITRRRYFTSLAELVGAPTPTFDPNADARHGSGGLNKRCRNDRLAKLGVSLAFPSIATGLPQAVGHE